MSRVFSLLCRFKPFLGLFLGGLWSGLDSSSLNPSGCDNKMAHMTGSYILDAINNIEDDQSCCFSVPSHLWVVMLCSHAQDTLLYVSTILFITLICIFTTGANGSETLRRR